MALPPPALHGAPPEGGQPAPILSFLKKYLDPKKDEDSGNMLGLLAFFDPMAVPSQNPNTLHTASSNESDLSTHTFAILQQDATDPGSVGRVTILHGIKVFPSCVGVPLAQWHGRIFAFVHNTLSCNEPQSMEFPVLDAFSITSGPGSSHAGHPSP
jgi:hypothetical protein